MDPSPDQASVWGPVGWQLAIWMALLVAFSPVLLDLSTHIHDNPWTRTGLIFPWLVWVASRRVESHSGQPSPTDPGRIIWLYFVLGLTIELVAVAGGSLRFGRVGLLVAIFGFCRAFYSLRPEVAVLLLWTLPLPKTLIDVFSPIAETLWGQGAAAFLPGVSLEMLGGFPVLATSTAKLPLVSTETGITMAFALAGLGWFRGVSSGRGVRGAMLGSIRWAMLALPVQLSFLIAAGVLLRSTDATTWSGLILAESSWIFVLVLGFVMALDNRGRATRTPPREWAP